MSGTGDYDPARPAPRECRDCWEEPAMTTGFWTAALMAAGLLASGAARADYEVTTRTDIVFAEHDGTKLLGDFYSPKGLDKAPVLVAVHGGGWQVGSRKFYTNW